MLLEGIFALFSHVMLMTSYVEKKTIFKRPLSKEKERELLERMWAGDESAKNELISHNMRLVAHIAKKYSNCYDIDELISVGSIGLLKAVSTYCKDKGTGLATYASRCIENEMLMDIRKMKKYSGDRSIYEPVSMDRDGNEITLIDLMASDDDEIDKILEKRELKAKLNSIVKRTLDDREYEIIKYRYGLEDSDVLTQREIAKMYGISRSYISRLEKKALTKLRTYMECNNIEL